MAGFTAKAVVSFVERQEVQLQVSLKLGMSSRRRQVDDSLCSGSCELGRESAVSLTETNKTSSVHVRSEFSTCRPGKETARILEKRKDREKREAG